MEFHLQHQVGGVWKEAMLTSKFGSVFVFIEGEENPSLTMDGVKADDWKCLDEEGDVVYIEQGTYTHLFRGCAVEDLRDWTNSHSKEEEEVDNPLQEVLSALGKDFPSPLDEHKDGGNSKDEKKIDDFVTVPMEYYAQDLATPSSPSPTLALTPSNANYFERLPRDVLLYLWGFLSFRELSALSKTSKTFRSTARRMPAMAQEREKWKQERHRQRMVKIGEALQTFLYVVFFNRIWEVMLGINVLWLSIVTPLRLDGVMDWPWVYILIPTYFHTIQMMLCLPLYQLLNVKFQKKPCERNSDWSPHLFMFMVLPVVEGKRGGALWIYAFLEGTGLWLLVSLLALSGVPIPWTAAMIPGVFIALVNSWCIMRFKRRQHSNTIDRGTAVTMIMLLALFFVAMGAKVDGYIESQSWYLVMAPLFVVEFMALAVPIVFTILASLSWSFRSGTKWNFHVGRLSKILLIHAAFFGGGLAAICIPFTMQMLVLQNVEEKSGILYSLIFIPIYLVALVISIGCCAMMPRKRALLD